MIVFERHIHEDMYMGKCFSICLQKETREIQVKELPSFEDVSTYNVKRFLTILHYS